MKKLFQYIIYILPTLFFSCDEGDFLKTVPIDQLPEYEAQLVVYSYISPDADSVEVYVTNTEPIYKVYQDPNFIDDFSKDPISGYFDDYELYALKGATVILKDEFGESITLPFNEERSVYAVSSTQFPIREGVEYFLEARIQEYQVTGSCIVPAKNESLEVTLEEVDNNNNNEYAPEYYVKATIDVPEGDPSYFRIAGYYIYRQKIVEGGEENEFLDAISVDFSPAFINASNKKGSKMTIVQEFDSYYSEETNPDVEEYWVFYLFNTDYSYYQFHYDELNYLGDNPFIEPKNFYSNLEGGVGVFAAYSRDEVIISEN